MNKTKNGVVGGMCVLSIMMVFVLSGGQYVTEVKLKHVPAHMGTQLVRCGNFTMPQQQFIPESWSIEEGRVYLEDDSPSSFARQAKVNEIRKLCAEDLKNGFMKAIMELGCSGNYRDVLAFGEIFSAGPWQKGCKEMARIRLDDLGVDASGRPTRSDSVLCQAKKKGNIYERLCYYYVTENRQAADSLADKVVGNVNFSAKDALDGAEFYRGTHRGCPVDFGRARALCQAAQARTESAVLRTEIRSVMAEIDKKEGEQNQLQLTLAKQRMANQQALFSTMQGMNQSMSSFNSCTSSGSSGGVMNRRSFKSVGHCNLHGDYDLSLGCPGCKGNVDFGSGKQMHCNVHNLNYDSKWGCPQCTRGWR